MTTNRNRALAYMYQHFITQPPARRQHYTVPFLSGELSSYNDKAIATHIMWPGRTLESVH